MQWEYKTIKIGYMYGPTGLDELDDALDKVEGEPTTCLWLEGGKFDVVTFNKMINDLGRQGWELVSVFDAFLEDRSAEVVAVFKRQLQK